ncbi:MAG: alkene reductase [Geminicoccaceae bacterium]
MAESELFAPFQLGPLLLPNRIVMAPMTRSRAGAGNVPSALNAAYYRQRTAAGLIVTEASQVSPQGVGYPATPGIHTDAQVEGWRRITDAVHRAGGRIFLQLWHVGRISHPAMQPGSALPVAPSAIAAAGEVFTTSGPQPFVVPRALATGEIAGVVAQFADGARRALAAGFDGVELHGANGYLIDQFVRDGTNRRTDRYGGSLENRTRFLLEVTEAVAGVWGAARVGVRLSPWSNFNSMSDSNPPATFGHAVRALAPLGLGYLHLVEPVNGVPAGAAPLAPDLKAAFGGPLMANGGYTGPLAEAALARGEADLVSFAAAFLANPDLPVRLVRNAPLNLPDPATFYGGDHRGYTDYPALDEALAA